MGTLQQSSTAVTPPYSSEAPALTVSSASAVVEGRFRWLDSIGFQLVVSADGSPLMVADSAEAVSDWLSERNYGVVSLH